MNKNKRIIDLTMMIEEGMQTFAAHWHPFVEISQLGRHGQENRETRKLVIGTHAGTHIDAPRHFIRGGDTVEDIPLEQLVGPALVIDFSHLPDFHEITENEIIEAVAGRNCERLILRYDWDDKALGYSRYYSDHPYLSEQACHWLVNSGCRLLAQDTPQPDNPLNGRNSSKDSPNHIVLLGAGIILVEYLVNLKSISKEEVDLVVAPILIREGDGAPSRCFVIES